MNKEKDRIRELERRVEKLEKTNEELRKIINYEIRNVNNSFRTFKDILLKMQEEKYAKMDKGIKIEDEFEQRIFNPLKMTVKENFDTFRKAAKEDLISEESRHEDYENYEEILKKKAKK